MDCRICKKPTMKLLANLYFCVGCRQFHLRVDLGDLPAGSGYAV